MLTKVPMCFQTFNNYLYILSTAIQLHFFCFEIVVADASERYVTFFLVREV